MRLIVGLAFFFCACANAEFAGRVRAEGYEFFEKQPVGAPAGEGGVLFQFEGRTALAEGVRLRFEPTTRVSTLKKPTDSFDGDLRDSGLEIKSGSMHFQLGSFIKAWEGTDGLNPMDIASIRSYRDPINSENLSSIGATAGGTFGEHFSWDALYVPWQTPTRMPGDSSPWWPRQTTQSVDYKGVKILFPDSSSYEIASHQAVGSALLHNWGLRTQIHFNSLDISAAYFVGEAQIPILQTELSAGNPIQTFPITIIRLNNPIVIRPLEYRRRTAAGAVVYNMDSWIFRMAGRYDQPFDGDTTLPGWSDQLVAQMEKTLTVAGQTVILSGGYAYEDGANQDQSPVSSVDPFHKSFLLGGRVPLSDELVVFFSTLIDTYKDSSFSHIHAERKLGPHWSVTGGLDWIRGSSESLLGIWAHQSRALLATQYQF